MIDKHRVEPTALKPAAWLTSKPPRAGQNLPRPRLQACLHAGRLRTQVLAQASIFNQHSTLPPTDRRPFRPRKQRYGKLLPPRCPASRTLSKPSHHPSLSLLPIKSSHLRRLGRLSAPSRVTPPQAATSQLRLVPSFVATPTPLMSSGIGRDG